MESTLDYFRRLLPINKHELDDELECQAEVFERISREVAACATEVAYAKDALLRTEARLLLDFKDAGGMSEKVIDANVKRHPDRTASAKEYSAALRKHEMWTSLQDAWRQRGYALKTLADLYVSSYFDSKPIEAGDARAQGRRINERLEKYEAQRAAVRAERVSRDSSPGRRRLEG